MSSKQINELKNLDMYKQFNTINQHMSKSELNEVMFRMNIDSEMIATEGAGKWQSTMGLIKYTVEMGMTSELYQELSAINPYLADILKNIPSK